MEDRIARTSTERPGGALIALAAILTITTAWWALALWPVGAEPEWLARTRAACFGSSRGGLPNAGGWILLVGEPLGMLATLVALWGKSLRRDLHWIETRRAWRVAATIVTLLLIAGIGATGTRVARAWAATRATSIEGVATLQRVGRPAPAISLVDQRGIKTSFADFAGRTVFVTFAYGHCASVCPSVVNTLRAGRRAAHRPDVPILIITLDPWRDTPDRLATLARHWMLAGDDRVLSGSVGDVEAALDSLGIGRGRNETTGDIDHVPTTLVIDADGEIVWRVDGGGFELANLFRRLRS